MLRPVIPNTKDKEANVGTIAVNRLLGITVGGGRLGLGRDCISDQVQCPYCSWSQPGLA